MRSVILLGLILETLSVIDLFKSSVFMYRDAIVSSMPPKFLEVALMTRNTPYSEPGQLQSDVAKCKGAYRR